jgi:hypothetical protein
MKTTVLLVALGLLVGSLAGSAPAGDKAFLWDGKHWQQISEEGKAGYIFGMGNLADFETAATKGKKTVYISQAIVDDLKTRTVMQIVQDVDTFFRENPGKLDTAVIEVVLRKSTKVSPPETLPKGGKK